MNKSFLVCILIILYIILMVMVSIMALIENNTLPSFEKENIRISIYDSDREKYNDFPELQDYVALCNNDPYILIDIKATNKDMERFDNHRESEVWKWFCGFANSIQNPYNLDLSITISNKNENSEKIIIYKAHMGNWNAKNQWFEYTDLNREVKYDIPLKYK